MCARGYRELTTVNIGFRGHSKFWNEDFLLRRASLHASVMDLTQKYMAYANVERVKKDAKKVAKGGDRTRELALGARTL